MGAAADKERYQHGSEPSWGPGRSQLLPRVPGGHRSGGAAGSRRRWSQKGWVALKMLSGCSHSGVTSRLQANEWPFFAPPGSLWGLHVRTPHGDGVSLSLQHGDTD